jgi:hypothetical protein
MSRDINKLTPEVKVLFTLFKQEMEEAKIPFIVTSVDRNILEQMALFVQGRLPLSMVNGFRMAAEMGVIKEDENQKVTWTLNSKHVTNMFDEDLNNDLSRAFDIAILKEGKPTWDLKVSVNGNEVADYSEAGVIGEQCGLKWGGRFSSPDYCHFEGE